MTIHTWRNPAHEAHINVYRIIAKKIPIKHQVSWETGVSPEYVDFSVQADAEAHLARMKETYGNGELCSFNSSGDWIEFTHNSWSIVDTEPHDDGYDMDRYY